MATTVNELNELAEQVASGISLMYATTARISEDVSSAALASFIREQRDRHELLQPIDQLVDAYYDAQDTVYDIYTTVYAKILGSLQMRSLTVTTAAATRCHSLNGVTKQCLQSLVVN